MLQAMEIAFDAQFLPSLDRLDPGDLQRVLKSVTRHQQEPDAPGLNLEQPPDLLLVRSRSPGETFRDRRAAG